MNTANKKPHQTEYYIAEEDDGMRLDRLCKNRFSMPNTLCQKACRKGLIRIDGVKVKANDRVRAGKQLQINIDIDAMQKNASAKKKPDASILTKAQIEQAQSLVVYKDEDLLVINKPSGLAVQGGSKLHTHIDALLPALQFDAKELPRLVHRIDKDTSGLLLLARHVVAARALQKLFANREIDKTYLALIVGVPRPLEGVIETRIQKQAQPEEADEYEKMRSGDKGKRAMTDYQVIDFMAKTAALVALKPITGRTHQLRVHMAEMECPIVGERKYAMRDAAQHLQLKHEKMLHLHAYKMRLPACLGKRERVFEVPLSDAMQHSLKQLGLTLSDWKEG